MKRKLLVLSLVAICLAILASGSLAYFTSEERTHNVITTGGVDIVLQEWADSEKTEPFENATGVMPGATVIKIAEIKNEGENPVWVRVKVDKSIVLAAGHEDVTPDTNLVELDIDTGNWVLGTDGYLYYTQALLPGEVSVPVFTSVTFNNTMGNEYQNATATVDIVAQAVQKANNGETVMEAVGWPNS